MNISKKQSFKTFYNQYFRFGDEILRICHNCRSLSVKKQQKTLITKNQLKKYTIQFGLEASESNRGNSI